MYGSGMHGKDRKAFPAPAQANANSGGLVESGHVSNSRKGMPTTLTVTGNIAKPGSTMFNAPIGDGTTDGHAFIRHDCVIIRDNVADEYSFVFNHPNSKDTVEQASKHSLEMARILKGVAAPRH